MSEELKPCPFCGSKDVHTNNAYPHYIFCLACNAMFRVAGLQWEKDVPKLIEAWNRRAR
ncbi:hypothetical protein Emin_0972 [Elusimicrobium minutum Pei191]|uniref:Restriction alleviation protein, Lar family n=1 Tax=Elusimicrobium minutum (strain Pei191) TaxID=445932 RepID=B2KDC9_ELUMP|nr:Lar family restriction alleviation protein [Elusimicrobium minutum]ACC98525.1 hypothetical protein Emin_0972 [Elusimicrobium minutum Pei191]